MRRLLHAHIYVIWGLGRTPLKLIIDQQIIGFWERIAIKISHLLINYLIRDSSEKDNRYNWLDNLISLFNNLGMSNIYSTKQFRTVKILLENIKMKTT